MHNLWSMTAPTPYIHLRGTARRALTFYGDVLGCAVQLLTLREFNRTDGPPEAIAHGYLLDGPVSLFAADVTGDEAPFSCRGLMLSLLGTATPSRRRDWFSRLSKDGHIVADLQARAASR
jgi:PhnB protein